ncbi:hypothetical protein BDFB_010069 [Asbolus verrucosus]|uniref:Uncharacterized protein n=1 Tax=Asbolus verrucosus TaxID=1661398 RepID=A0A482VGY6_ASBVE|nr:hypothetical protein BDFB_010069 [Asbolus verrucosus]
MNAFDNVDKIIAEYVPYKMKCKKPITFYRKRYIKAVQDSISHNIKNVWRFVKSNHLDYLCFPSIMYCNGKINSTTQVRSTLQYCRIIWSAVYNAYK